MIRAQEGDNYVRLAHQGGLNPKKFLSYNEMKIFQEIIPGETYYLMRKGSKAIVGFHTVERGGVPLGYFSALCDNDQGYTKEKQDG